MNRSSSAPGRASGPGRRAAAPAGARGRGGPPQHGRPRVSDGAARAAARLRRGPFGEHWLAATQLVAHELRARASPYLRRRSAHRRGRPVRARPSALSPRAPSPRGGPAAERGIDPAAYEALPVQMNLQLNLSRLDLERNGFALALEVSAPRRRPARATPPAGPPPPALVHHAVEPYSVEAPRLRLREAGPTRDAAPTPRRGAPRARPGGSIHTRRRSSPTRSSRGSTRGSSRGTTRRWRPTAARSRSAWRRRPRRATTPRAPRARVDAGPARGRGRRGGGDLRPRAPALESAVAAWARAVAAREARENSEIRRAEGRLRPLPREAPPLPEGPPRRRAGRHGRRRAGGGVGAPRVLAVRLRRRRVATPIPEPTRPPSRAFRPGRTRRS